MNKIYRVIWSAAHKSWIVVGEFAKGKQKSSNTNKLKLTSPAKFKILATTLLISGFMHSSYIFAASSCSVANIAQFAAALNNNDCTDILLTGDANLNNFAGSNTPNVLGSYVNFYSTRFDFGNRDTITIDGNNNRYSITNGLNPRSMAVMGGSSTKQVNLNFKNIKLATTPAFNY